MLQLAAIFSVHCAITLRGAMVTVRTKRTRSERVNAQCVTHGPDGARRLWRCAPPRVAGRTYGSCPVTRSRAGYAVGKASGASENARPARYGQKRCRYTRSMTAGNPSASWRAGPAGHPAPSAAFRCAGTGSVRIWHWAHLVHNPRCKAARETEWHLAWKVPAWPGGRAPRHRACPQPRPSTVP